jgi:hypothetical protein
VFEREADSSKTLNGKLGIQISKSVFVKGGDFKIKKLSDEKDRRLCIPYAIINCNICFKSFKTLNIRTCGICCLIWRHVFKVSKMMTSVTNHLQSLILFTNGFSFVHSSYTHM